MGEGDRRRTWRRWRSAAGCGVHGRTRVLWLRGLELPASLGPLPGPKYPPCSVPFSLGPTASPVLPRIHRRTALGTAPEEARGCSSESGIMVLEQKPARKQGAPNRCCHRTNPTVSASSLTNHRLVANAGLLLPATLARHLGLRELVDHHLDLGGAPGRANTGDKMLTLVAYALAGGDCIDDADALRAGGTVGVLGCVVKAPSTLGTFLRSFRWGHVRQLDRVSRQLLARAWAAGAGPGDSPLTIDLDSTICETYGLAKEGARHHGYTGARGYHPLLAIAAGTGEVLMSRLREGPGQHRPWRRPLPA